MRRAVVLMNLGGPDSPAAVRPFLYNLFSDRAIIRLPGWLRLPLAWLIAARRAPTAREIYAHLGGASPLLANTEAQARALETALGTNHRCFIAMRYWHPFTDAVVAAVKAWQPDQIILLPLYPQFSTTTTASSLAVWHREATRHKLVSVVRMVRSFPTEAGFVAALAGATAEALDAAAVGSAAVRLLFSAHGLPLKIVQAGDPYPGEVERTAAAVVEALARPGLDWQVCYQSRVGPLAWLGPSVDDELQRAGRDGVAVVVVPISFVSEHSETLVELDRDYRLLAERCGVPGYYRVPTVGTDPRFIAALVELVHNAEIGRAGMTSLAGIAYLWLKALHIISVIAWMAGLLYLPRLFVYHAGVPVGSNRAAMLEIMERRLLRGIMLPALVMTYGFGLAMAGIPGLVDWHRGWIWAKLALVAVLTIFHMMLARWRRDLAAGRSAHSQKFYRLINEIPTVVMIAIVVLVVLKPF